ncbi:MAG: 30S ribosomal protein S20 [Erysipelotrichaceae bacterium]|nr:30S ribosomal protein S20 [Erysipelotrichaceae bacterium]
MKVNKSQVKSDRTSKAANLRNSSFKSKMRTQAKRVRLAVTKNDKELALVELAKANSLIDKSVSKHVQHYKTAARQKSTLANLVNSL